MAFGGGKALLILWLPQLLVAIKNCEHPVEWTWPGALTPSSIQLKVKLVENEKCLSAYKDIHVVIEAKNPSEAEEIYYSIDHDYKFVKYFNLNNLKENTNYTFKVLSYKGQQTSESSGKFMTPKSTAFNFTFAMASCADEYSSPEVLNAIQQHSPLFFLHMGDLHYDNINENSINKYRNGYNKALLSPFGKKLMKMNSPVIYMWDDHDFGPDNSDKTARGREAALQTYREYVPHYPLDERKRDNYRGAVYQAFTIGRIRFILTDLRSERDPNLSPDGYHKSVLGIEQKEWFKKQLLDAKSSPKTIAAIIWCSTMPWIDDERKWGHFKYEQKELVDFIEQNDIHNLYIVSGDAHMVAVDDGSHSPGNIPVFHAAALGRKGSTKGGPYSHGVFPGNGQFGIMQVFDKGIQCDEKKEKCICLHFSGRNYKNQILQEYDTCNPETTPGKLYTPPPIFIRKLLRVFKKLLQGIYDYSILILCFLCASGFVTLFFISLKKRVQKDD